MQARQKEPPHKRNYVLEIDRKLLNYIEDKAEKEHIQTSRLIEEMLSEAFPEWDD